MHTLPGRWFDLPACLLLGLVIGGYLYGTAPCLYHGGDLVPCAARGSDGVVVAFEGLREWTTLPDRLMVSLVVGGAFASYLAVVAVRCVRAAFRKLGGSVTRLRKASLRWFDLPVGLVAGLVIGGFSYMSVSCLYDGGTVATCAAWGTFAIVGAFLIPIYGPPSDLPMVGQILGSAVVASCLAIVILRCARVARREDNASTEVDP